MHIVHTCIFFYKNSQSLRTFLFEHLRSVRLQHSSEPTAAPAWIERSDTVYTPSSSLRKHRFGLSPGFLDLSVDTRPFSSHLGDPRNCFLSFSGTLVFLASATRFLSLDNGQKGCAGGSLATAQWWRHSGSGPRWGCGPRVHGSWVAGA